MCSNNYNLQKINLMHGIENNLIIHACRVIARVVRAVLQPSLKFSAYVHVRVTHLRQRMTLAAFEFPLIESLLVDFSLEINYTLISREDS